MIIMLSKLESPFDKRGSYGASGNSLPARMRYLVQDAADSLRDVEQRYPDVFHYSDMYRTAEGSLKKREYYRQKKGHYWGLLPGYSGHGFGLSTDHEVTHNMHALGVKTKAEYDHFWELHGWYCHRRDGVRDREEWHYNYFGVGTPWAVMAARKRTTGGVLERLIRYKYRLNLTKKEIQHALNDLGHGAGPVDGIFGKKTKAAIKSFQKSATLSADGVAGTRTQRVLAFMNARIMVV